MSSNNSKIDGVLVAFKGTLGWTATKRNKERTKQVCDSLHASDDAGLWSDRLFPPKGCGKVNAYTRIKTHLGRMASFTRENTFQYEDEVWRILPSTRAEFYKAMINQGRTEAESLLQDLVAAMPALKQMAAQTEELGGRGDGYREEDYPDEGVIVNSFIYQVQYRPLPDTGMLNPQLFQEAIDQINQLNEQRLKQAQDTLIQQFLDPLAQLAEQLKDPKGKKIAPVIGSILEISAKIPQMDLNHNQPLRDLAQTVHDTFQLVSPELLKKDEETRKLIGETAGQFVTALSSFGAIGKRALA